jgi:hypothetical protein
VIDQGCLLVNGAGNWSDLLTIVLLYVLHMGYPWSGHASVVEVRYARDKVNPKGEFTCVHCLQELPGYCTCMHVTEEVLSCGLEAGNKCNGQLRSCCGEMPRIGIERTKEYTLATILARR